MKIKLTQQIILLQAKILLLIVSFFFFSVKQIWWLDFYWITGSAQRAENISAVFQPKNNWLDKWFNRTVFSTTNIFIFCILFLCIYVYNKIFSGHNTGRRKYLLAWIYSSSNCLLYYLTRKKCNTENVTIIIIYDWTVNIKFQKRIFTMYIHVLWRYLYL